MSEEKLRLSEIGFRRREEILVDLKRQQSLIQTNRKRLKFLGTGALVGCSLSVLTIFALMSRSSPIDRRLAVEPSSQQDSETGNTQPNTVEVTQKYDDIFVTADPAIYGRHVIYSSDVPEPLVEFLSDAELSELYSHSGEKGFIAFVSGRATILGADVAETSSN